MGGMMNMSHSCATLVELAHGGSTSFICYFTMLAIVSVAEEGIEVADAWLCNGAPGSPMHSSLAKIGIRRLLTAQSSTDIPWRDPGPLAAINQLRLVDQPCS